MRRRRFLELVSVGVSGLAGCSVGWQGDETAAPAGTPTIPSSVDGVELPVPAEEFRSPLPKDAIPAIVEPSFASDWSDLDPDGFDEPLLPDDSAVIGVEGDRGARAYPLRILNWHEIVNDTLDGPIAVTYCVLCGSGVVVERRVDGEPTVFGVSGQLWRNDLVMYDEATDSRWSQLLALAIKGPKTGSQLRILPSTLSTWGEWRSAHPDTEVLLPPPHSNTVTGREQSYRYFDSKYSYGDEDQLIGFDARDGKRNDRRLVIGITHDGVSRAYPFDVVAAEGLVEDTVGGRPVVVAVAPDGTLVAYDRRVDGRPRSFTEAGDRHVTAAGSRWELTTGRAVDGNHEGARLERANEHPPMFWVGWSNFNPESDVYGEQP